LGLALCWINFIVDEDGPLWLIGSEFGASLSICMV
jgi:hypothetical protein